MCCLRMQWCHPRWHPGLGREFVGSAYWTEGLGRLSAAPGYSLSSVLFPHIPHLLHNDSWLLLLHPVLLNLLLAAPQVSVNTSAPS